MAIHHHIIHHVQKHQKKYIFSAGLLSGRVITKFVLLIAMFFGMSKMGGITGADYYDVEFYSTHTGEIINISNIINTEELGPAKDSTKTETMPIQTGNIFTGTYKQGQ